LKPRNAGEERAASIANDAGRCARHALLPQDNRTNPVKLAEMLVDPFAGTPFLGILRGIGEQIIDPLVEALVPTGLQALEITMNTENAPRLIRHMIRTARGRLSVGAGTVLSMTDLEAALDAGAELIVAPTLIPEVVEYCAANGIPVFPGALTPQEILAAHQAGATMVKLFPASVFGPGYLREIKGPFRDIPLLACGGVEPDNVGSYFENGASAVAFGSSVFQPDLMESGNFDEIAQRLLALMKASGQGDRVEKKPV
jgi:2-dehydro-3-deoxyphosphogluconate aldolase/(4S)-4-hydroxy-2-oxoglutarate aldolase